MKEDMYKGLEERLVCSKRFMGQRGACAEQEASCALCALREQL